MENENIKQPPKPDSRVNLIRDYYIQWYGVRFQNEKGEPLKPGWGPKESSLIKTNILKYIDNNNIDLDRVFEVIDWFMQTNEEFVVKVDRRFSFLCQDFPRHYLAAIKNKVVKVLSPSTMFEKKQEKPKDPTDGMTWTEKRAYYDKTFHEATDESIRLRLEKFGPRFFQGLSWLPVLRKLAPDDYKIRVWKTACELWGEETCKKYLHKKS